MKAIFVTGTDTGVGKTLVTGLFARYLKEKNYKVITQKWVETGCRGFSQDIKTHLKIMGIGLSEIKEYLDLVSVYTFKEPFSPHKASALEARRINPEKIIKSYRRLQKKFDFVVIEGTGGALVPFNRRHLLIDLVRRLKLPVLVVAKNKVGAINHTLLTVEALRKRKIKITGIVFSDAGLEDKEALRDNPKIISRFAKEDIFGRLPWRKRRNSLYKAFIPIGEAIYNRVSNG